MSFNCCRAQPLNTLRVRRQLQLATHDKSTNKLYKFYNVLTSSATSSIPFYNMPLDLLMIYPTSISHVKTPSLGET